MSDTVFSHRLRQSIFISVGINCLMTLTGTVASLVKPLRWLSWVARAIATPPGLVLRFMIRPNGQSVVSYALAAVEGLLGSVVFYALLAWFGFWLYARWKGGKVSSEPA